MARTRCQTQVSSCAAAASSAPSARLGASRFSLLSSGTGLFMKSSGFTPRRPMLAPSSSVAGAAGGAGGAGAAGAARGSARGAGACHGRGSEGHKRRRGLLDRAAQATGLHHISVGINNGVG